MKRFYRNLMVAVAAPALIATSACGGKQDTTEMKTVGKPPGESDARSPRKSTLDDPSRNTGKVTPHMLRPGGDEEGGEGGEGGGEGGDGGEEGGGDGTDGESPGPGASAPGPGRVDGQMMGDMRFEGEARLANLRKLTAGGQNAEAYLNPSETHLVFQATTGDLKCDQIFTMKVDGSDVRQVSNGQGVTTCGYFMPKGDRVLFSSTHEAMPTCPPKPDFRKYGGYVWPIHNAYDIYTANLDGTDIKKLSGSAGYDAEATLSPRGDRIVFTSTRDGDLDLYSMKVDGTDVKRLTRDLGYDGGAFFSRDGKKIVFRAHHITDEKEAEAYKRLLAEGVVKPTVMEIFVMDANGKNQKQLTSYGAASFAPFFHPSGKWIVFSSNLHDPQGRDFDLYRIRVDGSGLERITYNPTFDGFPMFTADGKKLIFASNRANSTPGETNVFIADWIDE